MPEFNPSPDGLLKALHKESIREAGVMHSYRADALNQRAARPLNPQTQMNRATQRNAGYRKMRPAARKAGR